MESWERWLAGFEPWAFAAIGLVFLAALVARLTA